MKISRGAFCQVYAALKKIDWLILSALISRGFICERAVDAQQHGQNVCFTLQKLGTIKSSHIR